MSALQELLLETNLSSLICSLYTLSGNNKFFQKLALKNDIFFCIKNKDHFSRNGETFTEFYKLLNNPSLRRFAFILIKPVLDNTFVSFSSIEEITTQKKNYREETILLKKYLYKFKYNYYYFYYQKGDYENLPTEKEINIAAIQVLFLIVGI